MTLNLVRAWTMAASATLAASVCAEPAAVLPEPTRVLAAMYPGVRVAWDQGRITHLYGAPMTWGGTADAAATQWLDMHSAAFGAGPLSLRFLWSTPVKSGRFTAYGYQQFIDGMPVEYGGVQVLVLNGAVPRVVYAAGLPAARPAAGWAEAAMSGPQAVAVVRAMPLFKHLTSWTTPQAVVWQGEATRTAATRAWKFVGEVPKPNSATDQRYTFFVDVATGALLHARNDVHTTDVSGTVKGMGSPGTNPDIASNPPQALSIADIRMSITGGGNAFSDREGDFTIPNAGTAPVNVTSNLSAGRWVNVNPTGVGELTFATPSPVTPPGPVDAVFNAVPGGANSQTTAQVNAFIHATATHNYYKDRAPGYTGLDIVIPANTGVAGACNAFFNTAPSINFYNFGTSGGSTCNNTAYSSVVAHEYGHFVVFSRGLAQGAFGEGLGDVTGMLMYDDPIIGRNFTITGGIVRNPVQANIQYPCSSSCGGAVHCCGQILGGAWWRIRTNLGAVLGSGPGLDEARDLQVAWLVITTGGSGSNSAHPNTAIEVLTVDDNDGNLGNGTPHYSSICAAFDAHSIDCPPLQLVTFQYPSGRPALLTPNQATNIRVDVVALNGTPTANSGTVSYSVNGGSFQTLPMAVVGTNQYQATLPAFPCQASVRYYFGVGTAQGMTVTDPAAAPGTTFAAPVATGVATVLNDTFETNLNWSGVAPDDTATTGRWTRMDPQPTAAQPGDDVTPAPGVNCWVTDGVAGASIGERDVDGGKTTLTSPVLNLTGQAGATIGYWRWYSNTQGGAPNADVFTVDVSNNDGASWVNAETVGPTGPQANGGWFRHEFRVSDFVTPTATVRVRFVASDLGTGSVVEAAVDDVIVSSLECGATCYPDCNEDGVLTAPDFGCFQTRFVAGDQWADCNGDSVLTAADFGCFQTEFVAGCP